MRRTASDSEHASLRRAKPQNRSRKHGAHILPNKGLSERQRAPLVPEKPSIISRAADARLPAERGHTDGRVRTERVHERRVPDAETHDSGGW